jgi:hypothetical protein
MYSEQGLKYLTKESLMEVLNNVPDGSHLYCNAVGNIAVCNEEEVSIGFIDFLFAGKYE